MQSTFLPELPLLVENPAKTFGLHILHVFAEPRVSLSILLESTESPVGRVLGSILAASFPDYFQHICATEKCLHSAGFPDVVLLFKVVRQIYARTDHANTAEVTPCQGFHVAIISIWIL